MINQSRRILCSWQGIKERREEFVIRSLAHVTISHLYDLFTKGEKKKRLVRVNFVIASLSFSLFLEAVRLLSGNELSAEINSRDTETVGLIRGAPWTRTHLFILGSGLVHRMQKSRTFNPTLDKIPYLFPRAARHGAAAGVCWFAPRLFHPFFLFGRKIEEYRRWERVSILPPSKIETRLVSINFATEMEMSRFHEILQLSKRSRIFFKEKWISV